MWFMNHQPERLYRLAPPPCLIVTQLALTTLHPFPLTPQAASTSISTAALHGHTDHIGHTILTTLPYSLLHPGGFYYKHYCLAANVIGSEAKGTMRRAVAALKVGV